MLEICIHYTLFVMKIMNVCYPQPHLHPYSTVHNNGREKNKEIIIIRNNYYPKAFVNN